MFGDTFLTLADCVRISYEIAQGMEFVHSRGLIHRDLKPHNVMLGYADVAKIGDFGTAVFKKMTRGTLGTFGFQAPEVMHENEQKYGNKCDVFSFGMCLWTMATRSRNNPLTCRGMTTLRYSQAVKRGGFLKWPSVANDSADCKAYISLTVRCVSFSPDQRPSFMEMKRELGALVSNTAAMTSLTKIAAGGLQ